MKDGMVQNPDGSWDVNLTDEELDRALCAVSVPLPDIAPADDARWAWIVPPEGAGGNVSRHHIAGGGKMILKGKF